MRSVLLAALLAGAAEEGGGWPESPAAVVPLALAEEEELAPESPDAMLKDLRPGPAASRVEDELLDEGMGEVETPAQAKVREQVQIRMNAVMSAMAQLKGVIGNTRKRAEAMERQTDAIRNEMNRDAKMTEKQRKMYSAGAQNENKLHQFDASLMEHLQQARELEADLNGQEHVQKERMRNETEDKELTMGMILDWMNQKNGTDNEAGEPVQGTFQYTNLEFELMKEKSVRMTAGVNANARELSDIITRTRALEAEQSRAQEVLGVIQWYFTNSAMDQTVKKDMEQQKADRNEEGVLQISGARRPPGSLLQETANVTEVAPPPASSPLAGWLPVMPEPRWPGDAAGASVGAFSAEGAV